mmetsp:Transcript_15361/g.28931  ORF Transcript_15361/g.28931 Transcript_15361/m.28931 type:complete len:660 (+) Transcript_15361:59-2038(+)
MTQIINYNIMSPTSRLLLSSSSKGKEPEKTVRKVQPTLFGIPKYDVSQSKVDKVTGKVKYTFIRKDHSVLGKPSDIFPHGCCCGNSFKTSQALGAHKKHCVTAQEMKKKEDDDEVMNHKSTVFAAFKDSSIMASQARHDNRNQQSSILRQQGDGCTTSRKVNGRKNNPGSARRAAYSSRRVEGHREGDIEKYRNRYLKWSHDESYRKSLLDLIGGKKKSQGRCKMQKVQKSPFHDIESELYGRFVDKRKKSQKVSSQWLRITAKQIFGEKQHADPDKWGDKSFKASYGWMRRFMTRKKIKFRKRKCGKEKTAEDCIEDFEKFMKLLRFELLAPNENIGGRHDNHPLWGRFPPERRYNMDQVPLPFVVNQEATFTTCDDKIVNVKCPSESLRKRQFTMHLVFNAGKGDLAHGWCDLVCKGTGTRVSNIEKELWNDDVKVSWQPNAWVDTMVMKDIAHHFVAEKINKHGLDVWVILFCDNLSAHLNADVKDIFARGKVFLCYFPPNMTHFIQPIDAGLGRSVRVAIGNFLDEWLMDEDNLAKWETKLTACERRVLMTDLISRAMQHVTSNQQDDMRIGCFERTGCLLTWLPSDEYDSKIKPQGMKPGSFSIPREQGNDNPVQNVDPHPLHEEQAAVIEEELNIMDEEENNDDEVIDGNEND